MLDQVLHKSHIPLPSCHHEGCLLILQSSVTKVMHYSSHFIIYNHKNPKTTNYINSNYDCVIWKLIITSRYLGCMGPLPCPVSFDALEHPDTGDSMCQSFGCHPNHLIFQVWVSIHLNQKCNNSFMLKLCC